MTKATDAQTNTHQFSADTTQLLQLVAGSLYSDEEIFLRELISNGSDAIDKLRHLAVQNDGLYESDSDLQITVDFDKDAGTIRVTDNGVGMSYDEVIENLGTIARSGTKAFKAFLESQSQASGDDHLIGQFGVGFYSTFVVADRVVVRTRKAGLSADKGVYWSSEGQSDYTIEQQDRQVRGTEITLYMKEDKKQFLSDYKLREVIRKFSNHLAFPVMMAKVEDASSADENEEGANQDLDSSLTKVKQYEKINEAKALWLCSPSDLSEEDYAQYYKDLSHDFEAPLDYSHNRVEGTTEWISLIYIPKKAPFDLYNPNVRRGLKLYVNRVFIMDDAEQFLPMYLRFAKGVIDSSDLPLNVSREILQSNKIVDRINKGSVKRILTMLDKMAKNDVEKYNEFWDQFGQVLKEGIGQDAENKDRLAALMRFSTTHTGKEAQRVSFADYVSRMKDGQEKIYYLTADHFSAASHSPLLEMFKQKGIEVILLTNPVDEWMVSHLTEFDGKSLQSISQADVSLPENKDKADKARENEDFEAQSKSFESVLKQAKEHFKDRVEDIRLTQRLTESPACVVAPEGAMDSHMVRLMRSMGQEAPAQKPVLELNAKHALVSQLKDVQDDDALYQWIGVLLDQALICEGETLDNPGAFVKNVNQLMSSLMS